MTRHEYGVLHCLDHSLNCDSIRMITLLLFIIACAIAPRFMGWSMIIIIVMIFMAGFLGSIS